MNHMTVQNNDIRKKLMTIHMTTSTLEAHSIQFLHWEAFLQYYG